MDKVSKNHIVCAAIKDEDGLIIPGARHLDMIMINILKSLGVEGYKRYDQGFIDKYGNWLSRRDAYDIAEDNGQLKSEDPNRILYSENLY